MCFIIILYTAKYSVNEFHRINSLPFLSTLKYFSVINDFHIIEMKKENYFNDHPCWFSLHFLRTVSYGFEESKVIFLLINTFIRLLFQSRNCFLDKGLFRRNISWLELFYCFGIYFLIYKLANTYYFAPALDSNITVYVKSVLNYS